MHRLHQITPLLSIVRTSSLLLIISAMSTAMNWEELVGPTLLNDKDEEVPTSEALKGKKRVM